MPPGGMDELVEAYKHLLACVAKKVPIRAASLQSVYWAPHSVSVSLTGGSK